MIHSNDNEKRRLIESSALTMTPYTAICAGFYVFNVGHIACVEAFADDDGWLRAKIFLSGNSTPIVLSPGDTADFYKFVNQAAAGVINDMHSNHSRLIVPKL